jgi:SAM-dependent methyltransferase
MPNLFTLTPENFAATLGITYADLPADIEAIIKKFNFNYRPLSLAERDQVILQILQKLAEGSLTRSGKERHPIWEKAWAERAEQFVAQNYTPESLLPNYFNANAVIRLNRDYAQPDDPAFERNFSEVIRRWLFSRYLQSAPAIYEFGCGSGFNLVTLCQLYPQKRLYGLDWAASAVDLVNLIAQQQAINLTGRRFDFFAPDADLTLEADSAVITMCALEQIGPNHEPFVQFLLQQNPSICLNMEPLVELYHPDHLVDYLALQYHQQRRYLDGFLSYLKQLEAEGQIEIQTIQRVPVGNIYHEGYSFVVWRPVR